MKNVFYFLMLTLLSIPCGIANAGLMFTVFDKDGNGLKTMVTVQQFGNDLKFHVYVDESTGVTGDLRGIFFHTANETSSYLNQLSATGVTLADVLGEEQYGPANTIQNMGGQYPNINPLGPFDVGIEIGTENGAGTPDDFQDIMFVLSHSTEALDVDTFFGISEPGGYDDFVLGIRAQTVGEIGGPRDDSSKGGSDGGVPWTPPPTNNPIPEPASAMIWLSGLTIGLIGRRRKTCVG